MIAFTRAQMIDVLRRTCDEGWLNPLLDDPNSAAVLNALADVWSRVSLAADRDCAAGLISLAQTARPGSSTVSAATTLTGGTLARGTIFEDARGYKYLLPFSVVVPNASAVSFIVETLRRIEIVNSVDDPDIRFSPVSLVKDATNTSPITITTSSPHLFAEGQVVRVKDALGNTAANAVAVATLVGVTDPTTQFKLTGIVGNGTYLGGGIAQPAPFGLTVSSSTPTMDGAVDWLSVLGRERGILRQAGELDANYRARVRNIPDVVSPRAISEAAQGAAESGGLPFLSIEEPFEDGSSASLDGDLGLGSFSNLFWSNPNPGTFTTPFAYALDEAIALLLDEHEACAYFRIRPQSIPADPDILRQFLGPLTVSQPTPEVPSASNIYLSGFIGLVTGSFDFYDAGIVTESGPTFFTPQHPVITAALAAVSQSIEQARAACVQFDIDLTRLLTVQESGTINSAPTVLVFTKFAPVGKVWWVVDSVSGTMADTGATYVATTVHKLVFTFEDGSTFDTGEWSALKGAMHLNWMGTQLATKRVASVQGWVGSTGGQTQKIVMLLSVLETVVA